MESGLCKYGDYTSTRSQLKTISLNFSIHIFVLNLIIVLFVYYFVV